jgi:hypothetical protein
MSTIRTLAVLVALISFSSFAAAQGVDTGSLRGLVTDPSGAALPGVTVTAASAAVMGGHLTAVTSEEGLYRFPSLPPGVYEVRMELAGFQAIALSGVRINVGLALTIDRTMEVSAIQETLTVVGESPIVDTKNTSAEVSWTPELLQNVPSSRDLWSTMQQVPGLVMAKENVGGIESPFLSNFQVHGSVRGSHQYNFNGLDMSDMHSGIGLGYFNTDSMEEIQFSTSGISAEHSRGGMILNTVTKSGGNRFTGQVAGYYESSALQSRNVDDELRQRGVTGSGAPLDYLYDFSGSLGGPIKTDRVWFFGAARRYDVAPTVLNCTLPDGGGCTDGVELPNVTAKVTTQLGPANRLMVLYDRGHISRPNREVSQFVRLDAAYNEDFHYDMWQGKFDRILSSSLLLQAAVGRGSPPFRLGYHETHREGVSSAFDEITRVRFDAASQDFFQQGDILVLNANLTYFKDKFLGGAHDLKFGAEHRRGKLLQRHLRAGDVERRYQNGVAYRVIAHNTPVEQVARNYGAAGYIQDSVRLGRHLTLNLGVRTEWWRGDVPEQSNEPSSFADVFGGAATYPEQKGVMEWTTVSPRLGLAYDVRADSRVVAKATYGRYYFQVRSTDLNSFSNRNALATATFDWTDRNGNNIPEYPGEFGTLRSLNLPRLRRIDPNLEAPYSDEFSTSLEFGLTQRSSLSARYTYRKNGNMIATTDLALPDEAFSIPSTAIDPITGSTLNYWSLSPAYRTVVNQEVLTQFDSNYTRYHGVDLSFNRRFDGRWLLMGSVTFQDNYGRVGGYLDRNDREIFAFGQAGLDAQVIGKIVTTLSLPWDMSGSVFYRHAGGMNSNNSFNVNTDMARLVQVSDVTTGTLYRIRVEESGSFRQDATNIVDIRLSKNFRIGRSRVEALVDGFNMFNANNILATGTITGSNLNVPLRIVTPRVFRIGAKLEF